MAKQLHAVGTTAAGFEPSSITTTSAGGKMLHVLLKARLRLWSIMRSYRNANSGEARQAGAYWTPSIVTCIFTPYRAYLFIRYSHYDRSVHDDGNKKPPGGG
jgi:hypothetical protein